MMNESPSRLEKHQTFEFSLPVDFYAFFGNVLEISTMRLINMLISTKFTEYGLEMRYITRKRAVLDDF